MYYIYIGKITTTEGSKLKISNTVFTQNKGYNLFSYAEKRPFINNFETHNCLFVRNNVSLKSNVKNFEKVAVKKNVIGQNTIYNQTLFKIRETPYASSKLFYSLNIFSIKLALQRNEIFELVRTKGCYKTLLF